MKLLSYRDRDRVHLTDMIEVGLIGREMLATLTPELFRSLNRFDAAGKVESSDGGNTRYLPVRIMPGSHHAGNGPKMRSISGTSEFSINSVCSRLSSIA